MNTAIITDVRYRMSLSVIRSLGEKNIPIIAAESKQTPQEAALGFYSRYTSSTIALPDAQKDPIDFINDILELAKNLPNKPVLIPVGLDSLMAVSKYASRLEGIVDYIVPSIDSIETANDTNKLLNIANSIGIPCPVTTSLLENETIEMLSNRIKYPVVIKYREGELLKLKPEKRYRIIDNKENFCTVFSQMHQIQPFPLVQSYISGAGYGVSAVFDKNGQPIEIFCHKRLREYPVSGGPSCFCESVWDDRLVGYAIKLLKHLNWQGVAMVEFKGDLNGEIALMEINPRIWGSMPLSVASGSDVPFALYRASRGETAVEPNCNWNHSRYKLGKKMRFIFQDILSFRGYLKIKKDKPAFIFSYIKDLLNPFVVDGVLQMRDWRPSLKYILQAIKKAKI